VVIGGRVFAVPRENRTFAFDAATGEQAWDRRGLESTAGILGGAGPAATERVVVSPYSSGELTAYLTTTGRAIWEDDLTGIRGSGGLAALNDVAGDPVIADGTVYAASQSGRLVAIDLRDGDRLWTRNVGGAQAPYVAGNALFFVDETGDLYALDRATGETVWRTPLGAFQDPDDREEAIVWTGPILAGGRLLLSSNTERLISVDPKTGQIVAEADIGDPVSTPPVVAGGTIYVLTDDAELVAYR
jgi:outer membrane protein assembly factor BamB